MHGVTVTFGGVYLPHSLVLISAGVTPQPSSAAVAPAPAAAAPLQQDPAPAQPPGLPLQGLLGRSQQALTAAEPKEQRGSPKGLLGPRFLFPAGLASPGSVHWLKMNQAVGCVTPRGASPVSPNPLSWPPLPCPREDVTFLSPSPSHAVPHKHSQLAHLLTAQSPATQGSNSPVTPQSPAFPIINVIPAALLLPRQLPPPTQFSHSPSCCWFQL